MRTRLLGLPVDILSMEETVAIAVAAMRGERAGCQHVALNVAKLVDARRNPELDRDIRASDIIGIDGAGIALALRAQGAPSAPRVAGVDLFEALMAACAREGLKPFLLGARPEVVDEAARVLRQRHPTLGFAGLQHGYFSPADDEKVCRQIKASDAHCLFIALPTPRKERFMHHYRARLGVPFMMGVGGTLDVMAGRVQRAPRWVQSIGGEWLFRLAQEPRRLVWRYLRTNAIFAVLIAKVVVKRLGGKRGVATPQADL